MATNPSEKVPLKMAFLVVPTNSSSPSTSAIVRTAPNFSGIWRQTGVTYIATTFTVPEMWLSSLLTHAHTIVVHLTLSLGGQVSTPADDLSVFAPPAEQSATL